MEHKATTYPRARVSNLVTKEMPEELLVYDLKQHKAHCLNQSAAQVWKYCDGKTSVAIISQILTRELRTEIDKEFVWLAIAQLQRSQLLENDFLQPTVQSKMSRRRVLRRLAGVALIPVVTSILAPTAQAGNTCIGQSCGVDQCACSDCCNTAAGICAQANSLSDGAPCSESCQCISGDCSGTPRICAGSVA